MKEGASGEPGMLIRYFRGVKVQGGWGQSWKMQVQDLNVSNLTGDVNQTGLH